MPQLRQEHGHKVPRDNVLAGSRSPVVGCREMHTRRETRRVWLDKPSKLGSDLLPMGTVR